MHFNWSSLIRYFSKDYETFITCDDEGWMWWVATRAVALVYGLYRIIVELQLIVEKQWIAIFIINLLLFIIYIYYYLLYIYCFIKKKKLNIVLPKVNYVKNLLFQDFYLKRKIVHSMPHGLHSFLIQFYLKFSL